MLLCHTWIICGYVVVVVVIIIVVVYNSLEVVSFRYMEVLLIIHIYMFPMKMYLLCLVPY